MPSIVSGYEYDIFISYRHNDNLDGWVTEFVKNLDKELKSTLKDTLSIYFDKNPHDGLLETHHVDKSLEGKLKSLIFIPIISQTYCDPKSFAWKNEFCVFNKLTKEDQFGWDIKLGNGNVGSRILPIKIHDLDEDDKSTIENELGGPLRAIEFIFKNPGVNRPLTPIDNPEKNLNQTFYRDQVNKTANAVKELISSLKQPASTIKRSTASVPSSAKAPKNRKSLVIATAIIILMAVVGYVIYPKVTSPTESLVLDKSIAVLPFDNLSGDPDQQYFSDGVSEEILNVLSQMSDLKVSGRTSSFSFRDKQKSIQEIGEILGVGTVLEGSIRKTGNRIRVTAQLINVKDGFHIFSEQYDRDMTDIFAVQDEIAALVSEKLKLTLLNSSSNVSVKYAPKNEEAHDQYLQGLFFLRLGRNGILRSKAYFEKAIELDPDYAMGYYGLGAYYSWMSIFYLLPAKTAMPLVLANADKALKINSDQPEALALKGFYYQAHEYDFVTALIYFKKSISLNPNYAQAYGTMSILYHNMGDSDKALIFSRKANELEPLRVVFRTNSAEFFRTMGDFDSSLVKLKEALRLDPGRGETFLSFGEHYLGLKDFIKAIENFEEASRKFADTGAFPMKGLIIALWLNGDRKRSSDLFDESLKNEKLPSFFTAEVYATMGNNEKAIEWLIKSYIDREVQFTRFDHFSRFETLQNDPRFKELKSKIKYP